MQTYAVVVASLRPGGYSWKSSAYKRKRTPGSSRGEGWGLPGVWQQCPPGGGTNPFPRHPVRPAGAASAGRGRAVRRRDGGWQERAPSKAGRAGGRRRSERKRFLSDFPLLATDFPTQHYCRQVVARASFILIDQRSLRHKRCCCFCCCCC